MPEAPIVRRAKAEDLPSCAAIVNADIDEREFMLRTIPATGIAAMFVPSLLEDRVMLVAEVGGDVVGYLSSMPPGDVRGFYVRADARGAGVGRALMDRAKAEFPEGMRLTAYVPNIRAQAFYKREGFVDTGRITMDDEGVPVLHLEWVP